MNTLKTHVCTILRCCIIMAIIAIMHTPTLLADNYNATTPLPDSLITEDKVYELTFTDMETAKRIIDEMRRRHLQPKHELDMLEGDLLINNRYFDEAAAFYLAALESDSVVNDPDTYMSLLHRMISCYDGVHDEKNTARYVELLLKEARASGNKAMEAIALFNMGKMAYYQEDEENGYKLMLEATAMMERCDYAYKYDNLRYNYNTLLIMQQRDERYEEALGTLKALEKVVSASTEAEPDIAYLNQKELKTLYAQQAIILHKLKRDNEADEAYKKWKSTAPEYTADDYIIAPYLIASKRTGEAIKIYSTLEKNLRDRGDTISYHMRSLLRSMGLVYYRTGQYKTSAEYFLRHADVTDSLKVREQNSSAQELAAAYETHKKETELAERANSIKMRNAWIVGITIALIMLIVILQRQIRHAQLMKRKNAALVKNIQELLSAKSELASIKQQPEPQELNKTNNDGTANTEYGLIFEQMDYRVDHELLFLNPDLTRDDLMRIAHVDKNVLAKIIQQHQYANTSDYINRKRLEYAAGELEKHPEYTINAIAESCGLPNVPTFNRLFRKHFGMTPTEFRKAMHNSN